MYTDCNICLLVFSEENFPTRTKIDNTPISIRIDRNVRDTAEVLTQNDEIIVSVN